jgi:hypothetical protein
LRLDAPVPILLFRKDKEDIKMGTAFDTSRRAEHFEPEQSAPRRGWGVGSWGVGRWLLALLAVLVVGVYIASFYFDSIIRARVLKEMNAKLVGYHTTLAHAHLQLLDGSLTLYGLVVHQDKHPNPPVADIARMGFHIQWREVFERHVVADVLLTHPHVHINLIQLRSEKADPVPLSQKGWQDAIQAIYPFKINLFRIRNGEFTYIDTDPNRPLHFTDLTFRADNIRNIHYRAEVYPSPFHAESVVFEKGRMTIDGKANFLTRPLPAMLAQYWVENIPLKQFEPELQRANVHIYGGTLESKGLMEYTPKIERFDVQEATIDGIHLDYVHTAQTAPEEKKTVETVKKTASKVANSPDVDLKAREVNFVHSELKYLDESSNPHYELAVSDMSLKATNLSNHLAEGPARVVLNGKLMGTGQATMTAVLRPSNNGPDLDLDLAAQDVDLTKLNDLLRAYGKFDVAQGKASVYMQMSMKNHYMTGYVKPLFTDVQVYDAQKDKKKPILHQAYELAIGGAAKLLKNRSTKDVATKIDISGPVNTPNVSVWQAIGQSIQNAFVKAIIPGYEHEISLAKAQK